MLADQFPVYRRVFLTKSMRYATFLAATHGFQSQAFASQFNHRKLRVGQIGILHGHAIGKLETVLKRNKDFELIGIAAEDDQAKHRLLNLSDSSDKYLKLPWMTTDELLRLENLDLVLVETPIDRLLSTALKCIDAGCHVHLDKPAGSSLTEFRSLLELSQKHRKIVQLGYMFRSNPGFQFLFKAVQDGLIGNVFEVHAVMSKKVSTAERVELARYRGGAMFELGCHLIDALITLLGEPQSVTAFNTKTHPEQDDLFDNCLAVFRYPKATATIRSSVVEVDGGLRRQFVVCGTKGTIAIYPLEPAAIELTLEQATAGYRRGKQKVEIPQSPGRYDGDLLSLASAIRGESNYEYHPEHDLIVQECILRASEMPIDK